MTPNPPMLYRTLFDNRCRATPARIADLLERFLSASPPLLTVTPLRAKGGGAHFCLHFPGEPYPGSAGIVTVQPLAEGEAQVEVLQARIHPASGRLTARQMDASRLVGEFSRFLADCLHVPRNHDGKTVVKVVYVEHEPASFADRTGWDRLLVQMWRDGYDRTEIAARVKVTPERVSNRISELRREYGPDLVPYRQKGSGKQA